MKKIIRIIGALLVGFLIWYLVIKPYDYLVTFKIKANTGTINQSLKLWNSSLENSTSLQQENLNSLLQQVKTNDSTYTYNWAIHSLNDSMSQVKVYVKDINNSFQNKISTPFSTTDFEKTTKNTITDFIQKLKEHLKRIKVTVKGESKTQSTYCAYVSFKGKQIEKAKGMMKNYSFLNSVLFGNSSKVKANGTPFVEITKWNIEKDSIEYNFCFPIIKSNSLPKHELLKYKEYKGVKAIKAVYNGNYITSDRAWYALLEYAKKENIAVQETPVEVFYNNPNYGGSELRWKAEIFMPIKGNEHSKK